MKKIKSNQRFSLEDVIGLAKGTLSLTFTDGATGIMIGAYNRGIPHNAPPRGVGLWFDSGNQRREVVLTQKKPADLERALNRIAEIYLSLKR